jgi:hypothetical protein
MELTEKQKVRANMFHNILKHKNDKYFEENNIIPCKKCKKTGLSFFENSNGERSWDTNSYCDECNGIGFKGVANGLQVDLTNFICRKCDGIGCKECNDTGVVDWIAHMMGR